MAVNLSMWNWEKKQNRKKIAPEGNLVCLDLIGNWKI